MPLPHPATWLGAVRGAAKPAQRRARCLTFVSAITGLLCTGSVSCGRIAFERLPLEDSADDGDTSAKGGPGTDGGVNSSCNEELSGDGSCSGACVGGRSGLGGPDCTEPILAADALVNVTEGAVILLPLTLAPHAPLKTYSLTPNVGTLTYDVSATTLTYSAPTSVTSDQAIVLSLSFADGSNLSRSFTLCRPATFLEVDDGARPGIVFETVGYTVGSDRWVDWTLADRLFSGESGPLAEPDVGPVWYQQGPRLGPDTVASSDSGRNFTLDDFYLVRGRAELYVASPGAYAFRITDPVDNAIVLLIDGVQLLGGAWTATSGSVPGSTYTIRLSSSQVLSVGVHALVVYYYEMSGNHSFSIDWKKPDDTDYSSIPAGAFVRRVL